jgi:allantoinase
MNDLNVTGGIIVDSKRTFRAGIGIKDGKIVAVSAENLPLARHELEADGCVVMPGMIDSHVHVRAPGFAYREDFQSATAAAIAGGVTTIVEMPVSNPPTSSVDVLLSRIKKASDDARTDFAFYAGAGNENCQDIKELAKYGIVGYKTFLMPPPEGREKEFYGLCVSGEESFKEVLGAIKETGLFLAIHAEDQEIIARETKVVQQSGLAGLEGFSLSRPPISEVKAVQWVIELQKISNTRVMLCHISTPQAVDMINDAKRKGFALSTETCPHYLFLSEEGVRGFGPYARVKPPIRPEALRKQLWSSFQKGSIDVLSSDHAPYTLSEKGKGISDIWQAPDGIAGLELSLPLLLNRVSEGSIAYSDIVRVFSENPAILSRIYPLKGSLAVGSDADLVIVKPNVKNRISLGALRSKSGETVKVYENWPLTHEIVYTLCRGQVLYEKGQVVGKPGYGKQVRPINMQPGNY